MDSGLKLLSTVEYMHSARSLDQFRRLCVEALQSFFPESLLVYHEIEDPGRSTQHFCTDSRASLEIQTAWRRLSAESPVVRYYQAGGTDPVIATQDLITTSRLRSTTIYNECWKPFGVTHQIGMRLWSQRSVAGLSIKRHGKYSFREVELLRALYPHFWRAWKAALEAECDLGPDKLIVLCGSYFRISNALKRNLSTAEIADLNQLYQKDPNAKKEGVRVVHLHSGRRLSLVTRQRNEVTWSTVLSLSATTPWLLTTREEEVIQWMSEGKRDQEIAIILGISHRTVEKHVENILSKLNAENRTSATRQYLQAR